MYELLTISENSEEENILTQTRKALSEEGIESVINIEKGEQSLHVKDVDISRALKVFSNIISPKIKV